MPSLEFNIFNQKVNLSYQENEKDRLTSAVDSLNKSWKKFSHLQGKVSDIKILILISLELQDTIENFHYNKNNLKLKESKNEKLEKDIQTKNMEIKESLQIINKIKIELDKKNNEIIKTENILDELNDELLEIKNFLKNNYE